jgi:hypothetical protein
MKPDHKRSRKRTASFLLLLSHTLPYILTSIPHLIPRHLDTAPQYSMHLSDLPTEVLSNIVSLIPAAYHPPQNPTSSTYETLDPQPIVAQTPLNTISATCKVSHKLLEAARPWLWENVDVRSGRGWLAVVNALTEEVMEEETGRYNVIKMQSVLFGIPTPASATATEVQPVSPEEAHSRPMTIANLNRYLTMPETTSSYPNPYSIGSGSASTTPLYLSQSYSPPHVSIHQLLTPTDSPSPNPSPLPILNSHTRTASPSPRLRGRSRSPRRSLVGFNTEGISAVLERSRSVSASTSTWPKVHGERRRTSLSRTRTWSDKVGDSDEDDEDEEDDEVMDLPSSSMRSPRFGMPPTPSTPGTELEDMKEDFEEERDEEMELLPPPGPYIRQLSFTNFRTIGGRRTQDEAIRGRFVTAGRLEGVIKVSCALPTIVE